MNTEIVKSVSSSLFEPAQEANIVVELSDNDLTTIAGGIRAIGLITVDKRYSPRTD